MRSRTSARITLITAILLVFHTMIASAALGTLAVASDRETVTTIVCTSNGPRVITQALGDASDTSEQSPHTGGLPHCCTAGCAIADGAALSTLFLLAWFLPPPLEPAATPEVQPPSFAGLLARSPGRPRAPPALLA